MDMNKLMKQAQKMQREMAQKQEALAQRVFEASSGGGMVTAKINGKQELLELKIEPDVVDKSDIPMLQDLIVAAVNEAHRRAAEEMQKEMSSLMGGMGLPGMF
ncbi:YbaB/EbfC family nucleoid-associated protein [Deltaproteobacteria bacterium PRO3]|nr:YbaB/EbfC family nucleoid-associated protein [Deltaproteobacteria bacterium PRO3]